MLEVNPILKLAVMRRVYLIYWWRRLAGSLALKLTALGALLALHYVMISLRDVWTNLRMHEGVLAMSRYLFSSFLRTEFAVQALVFGLLALVLFTSRDLWSRLFGEAEAAESSIRLA